MSHAFGGSGAYGRFSPINQGPSGMPIGPPNDPPGYYRGWPLANVAKRLAASLVDWVGFWVVAWFGVVVIGGALSAVGGDSAGQVAIFPLLILIYFLWYYNVTLQQSRTGQSWGKRMLGLRLVKMSELRPPSKMDLTFRPIIGVFEITFGVGILSMLLSRYRQSFGDRFSSTVVIDEKRAGMTLPWALPGDPVIDPGPPVPQGGVPRPEKPRRSEPEDAGPLPWTRPPSPDPQPWPPAPSDGDLPEREFGDEPPPRRRPRTSSGDLPPLGQHVERDGIGKLHLPPGFGEPPKRQARAALPPSALPGPQPSRSPSSPAEMRYLTDPTITEALRARDTAAAHQRARACIDAAFDEGDAIDVEQAIAEYRTLIASAGLVIRASDDTVATWLGLV